MVSLVDHLRGHGDRPAVLTDSGQLSYVQLADRVAAVAAAIGTRRRLVLIETRNDVDSLTGYLGALAGDHVALPVPAGRDHTSVMATYRPDVVIDGGGVHTLADDHPVGAVQDERRLAGHVDTAGLGWPVCASAWS